MTARSHERGSHAGRPRNYRLPFSVPGLSGREPLAPAGSASPALTAPPDPAAVTPDMIPPGTGTPVADSPALAVSAPPLVPAEPAPASPASPAGTTAPADPVPPSSTAPPAGTVPTGNIVLPGNTVPPANTVPPPGPAAAGGGAPPDRGRRHRRPAERPPRISRKLRLVAIVFIAVAVIAGGALTGLGRPGSAEPAAQAFLLAWQQGHYGTAAALTTGDPSAVKPLLASAYTDLDASNEFFSMGHITEHGDTATATFTATVDLAQTSRQWTYTGSFRLSSKSGHWVVDWAPSVVNPALGPGERLAVQTTFTQRAAVEDFDGKSLLGRSDDYRIGVIPGKLKNPAATAAEFSTLTGLDQQQVLGQIKAAPPQEFLSLLTLDQTQFASLQAKLKKIAGLRSKQVTERLFHSTAEQVVGTVGTEDSTELRQAGAAYQPGVTIGQTGLEKAYQDQLSGTPTTTVVVVNAAGRTVNRLWSSADGQAGAPVKTMLSSQVQAAAAAALSGQPNSAEIVAVDTGTGAIRAVASSQAGSLELPDGGALGAQVAPGMAFSIVSAAALLSSGVSATHSVPCEQVADVGGQTFSYQPAALPGATLATDFAAGCGTAFANMSRTLTPQQLTTAARAFGVGASWKLRLPAFSGSVTPASGEGAVAALATGTGGVMMSPLGLAEIAAAVASGTGHTPTLTTSDTSQSLPLPLSAAELTQLRQLMRLAVSSGSASAANVADSVYGQAGVVKTDGHYLSWFVGYHGHTAVAVLETGHTAKAAAAAAAGAFFKAGG